MIKSFVLSQCSISYGRNFLQHLLKDTKKTWNTCVETACQRIFQTKTYFQPADRKQKNRILNHAAQKYSKFTNLPTSVFLVKLVDTVGKEVPSRLTVPKVPLYYSNICPTICNFTQCIFYLETALHVSGGISAHNQERKQLYLHHLVFVTPLELPAAIGG
jgi:hypothetical protein